MGYKKFVFGETLDRALEAIPEEHQLRFYKIVKNYGLHGIEPDLSGFEKAAWVQMKDVIDNTMPKQDKDVAIARSHAGKKGMEKRWDKESDVDDSDNFVISDDAVITKITSDNKNNKTDFVITKKNPDNKNNKMVMGMVMGMEMEMVNENENEKENLNGESQDCFSPDFSQTKPAEPEKPPPHQNHETAL